MRLTKMISKCGIEPYVLELSSVSFRVSLPQDGLAWHKVCEHPFIYAVCTEKWNIGERLFLSLMCQNHSVHNLAEELELLEEKFCNLEEYSSPL